MRADYRVIELDEFNHNLLINGLNEFRNMLLNQGKPTEDVDNLLLKLIDARKKRERRRESCWER